MSAVISRRTAPAPAASAVMVVRSEPMARLQRAVESLTAQQGIDGIELVIAAPFAEHSQLQTLRPHGAVGSIVLVGNPGGERSAGLNRAVAAAGAAIVVRVDARSVVPPDYVANCATRLAGDPTVGVAGGVQYTLVESSRVGPRGIGRALRNPWMLGNAQYRRPGHAGPVDTAYLGSFRRDELIQLGGYDERLKANEDFELCQRYRSAGMKVWLEPGATIGYEPRAGLVSVFRQYCAFGAAKVQFWSVTGGRPNRRQVAALAAGTASMTAAAVCARRPTRALALAAGAVAVAAVIDHLAEPTEPDLRVRAQACLAYAAIGGGWFCGVASETARVLRRARPVR